MQRILLTIIVALACSAALAAEPPRVKVEVDRKKIFEGESLRYTVTLDHVQNPHAPDLKALEADFDVASLGEQSMNSSFVTVINGQMTKEEHIGRQYNYRLTPRQTGTIQIPGPTVTVDGQTIQGNAVTILVRSPEEQDVVRMTIQTDRTAIYPMQPFDVTLAIDVKALPSPFESKNPLSVQSSPPSLQMPWALDEQLPKDLKPSMEWRRWLGTMEDSQGRGFGINGLARETVFSMLNNQQIAFMPSVEKVRLPDKSGKEVEYWRYEFRRTFVAKKIGGITFGPASLKGGFATNVIDGNLRGEDIYAVAKPLTVEVQDVPLDGRPECYIGAVGKFQLAASLKPTRVKTGDPMTLTLSLEGEGTLDSATPPDLQKIPAIADHFKIYEATEQTKDNRRQFTYGIRPLNEDIHEFPAVPAAYFDVDTQKYVTMQTQPIPIEVTKAVPLSDRDIITSGHASNGHGREITTRREGVFANVNDMSQLGNASVRPERWLIGGGGLLGIYFALVLGIGRWRRIHADPALLRRRNAANVAKQQLAKASAEWSAGHVAQAAEHILDALLGYIADLLGLAAAGLTATEACRKLESLGVDATLVGRLQKLLETCEGMRYGASAGTAHELGSEAVALFGELAAALKQKCKNGQGKSMALRGLMLVALLFSGGCGRNLDFELAQKFQASQQTFDNAKSPEDYAKAASLDQEMLDRWGPSGAVFYNQGNSWMQAGQPGRAVAAYRQAQRYSPRIPFLDANLATALGDSQAAKRPILETILFWQNWLSYAEKFYLAAAVAGVVFVLSIVLLFISSRWLRRARWISLAFLVVFAFSAGYDWYRFDAVQHGVIIRSEAIARKGNAESYEPAFNKPLHEATEFQLVERRGDWLLVHLPDGNEGWIEDRDAVVY
jgi:tetratricopeptide (TPR) repeat protein